MEGRVPPAQKTVKFVRERSRSRGRAPLRSTDKPVRIKEEKKTTKEQKPKPVIHPNAQKPLRQEVAKLSRQIKTIKKREDGPKVEKTMYGIITIGIVNGPEKGDNLQRHFHLNLHPILLKSVDSGTATTPLTIAASQYAKWRYQMCKLTAQPRIGSSLVGGTSLILSLDEDAGVAKDLGIDSVLARRTKTQAGVGQNTQLTLSANRLRGPMESWWQMNTNEPSNTTLNKALDVHTFCEAFNLLGTTTTETTQYKGPLWLLQLHYTIEFTGYEPKPAMQSMVNEEMPVEKVAFTSGPDGEMTVQVTETTGRFHQVTDEPNRRRRRQTTNQQNTGELGNNLWQIAGDVVEGAASSMAGPWSWLVKGGLWFLRRLFPSGQGYTDEEPQYVVYASVDDAQADKRVYGAHLETPIPVPVADAVVTQLSIQDLEDQGDSVQITAKFPTPNILPMANPMLLPDGTELTREQSVDSLVISGMIGRNRPLKFFTHFGGNVTNVGGKIATTMIPFGGQGLFLTFGTVKNNIPLGPNFSLWATTLVEPPQFHGNLTVSGHKIDPDNMTTNWLKGNVQSWVRNFQFVPTPTNWYQGWYRTQYPFSAQFWNGTSEITSEVMNELLDLNGGNFSQNTWISTWDLLMYASGEAGMNGKRTALFICDGTRQRVIMIGLSALVNSPSLYTTWTAVLKNSTPFTAMKKSKSRGANDEDESFAEISEDDEDILSAHRERDRYPRR